MDTIYNQMFTPAPPQYNLLYEKALHMGTFGYSDGDINTINCVTCLIQNY